VLAVDKLAAGDIAFGSNSWRGDRYESELRKQILTPSHNPQKRDGAQHTENSPGDDKSTRQSHEVNPK
jgi:hypothetical protein